MLDQDAIECLVGLGMPEIIEVDGKPFVTKQVHLPPGSGMESLHFNSLGGIAGYVTENRDGLDSTKHFLSVVAPDKVVLFGPCDAYGRRSTPAVANAITAKGIAGMGSPAPREHFHIALASLFAPGPDREDLLRLISEMKATDIQTLEDDGLTQRVTVSGELGVLRKDLVRPYWSLAPYASFMEVEQVERKYLLRLATAGRGEVKEITVCLYEADGGLWRIEANGRIARWLKANIPETSFTVLY